MAAFNRLSFPLPSKRRRRPLQFPKFLWDSINIKKALGIGTFGSVYLVDFTVADKQCSVVVKKLKSPQDRSVAFRRKLAF